jgi:hypothetical protein
MGTFRISGTLRIVGWLTTAVMATAVVAMFCFL